MLEVAGSQKTKFRVVGKPFRNKNKQDKPTQQNQQNEHTHTHTQQKKVSAQITDLQNGDAICLLFAVVAFSAGLVLTIFRDLSAGLGNPGVSEIGCFVVFLFLCFSVVWGFGFYLGSTKDLPTGVGNLEVLGNSVSGFP